LISRSANNSAQLVVLSEDRLLEAGFDKLVFETAASWKVYYFGNSYEAFLKIHRLLPKNCELVPIREALSANAELLKEHLINIEESQLKPSKDRLWWDASDLADKGPYATNLLLNASRFKIFHDACGSGGNLIFIVGDGDLGRLLYEEARKKGMKVGWQHPGSALGLQGKLSNVGAVLKRQWRCLRTLLAGLSHVVRMYRAVRTRRRLNPVKIDALREADVLLVVWSAAHTFPKEGLLKRDGNLGRIPEILKDSGLKVGYLVNQVVGNDSIADMADNITGADDPVLALEDCLSIGEILKAAVASLIDPWRIQLDASDGYNSLEPILWLERQREIVEWRPVQTRLVAAFGTALKRLSIFPKVIVHQYENQPWEKVLRMALRANCPAVRIVGCQHVPLPSLFINNYPSKNEIREGLLPDKVIVAGKYFIDMFAEKGFPKNRLTVGGALRYESLMNAVGKEQQRESEQPVTILCCTSIDFDESFELVHKVVQGAKSLSNIRIVINFHPSRSNAFRKQLSERIAQLSDGVGPKPEYSDRSVRDLMEETDVVAYNTSSSALDALLKNKRTLCVLRDLDLVYDRVPSQFTHRVCSPKDIQYYLERLPKDSALQRMSDGFMEVLAPVNDKVILDAVTGRED